MGQPGSEPPLWQPLLALLGVCLAAWAIIGAVVWGLLAWLT